MAQSTRRLMMGAAGASGEKTYIDDVFSTYLYRGDNSAGQLEANGIDLAGEGGLVWIKDRDAANNHVLFDTERLPTQMLRLGDTTAGNETVDAGFWGAASNGFTHGNWDGIGQVKDYASWTWRKQKGFFDIVTWTGNGSTRTIAHNLGSVPGCIMVKNTSSAIDWAVWHRGAVESNATNTLKLNTTDSASTNNTYFDNGSTPPTKDNFTVHTSNRVNAVGETYIAYVFAGGASTDATAKSVFFYGTSDYLSTASSSDLTLGTGDFTVECWMKWDSEPAWNQLQGVYQISTNSSGVDGTYAQTPGVGYYDTKWKMYGGGGSGFVESGVNKITPGVWYHVAHVRASSVSKLYLNGVEIVSMNDSYNYTGTYMAIGAVTATSGSSDGYTSNMRVVKGTALYTSSFRPPTEPLTNISGTSILCCNNTSTTGKTVGPTLTANGQIDPSTHSPFDDLQGFKFGEGGNENIIKCGTYKGQGAVGNEVFLGFEPQWVLIKCTTNAGGWRLFDSMRGIASEQNDYLLQPNSSNAEVSNNDWIDVSPTGFILNNTDTNSNGGGYGYSYVAIRRPDPLVGKPAEAGTDVFAMDGTANGSNVFPQYTSGFPVDFSLTRNPTVGGTWESWHTGARLLQGAYQLTATTNAWSAGGNFLYDYNDGIFIGNWANYMSWMWKRHAGFDVVTYNGNGVVGRQIPHNLSKIPEMLWIKCRNDSQFWVVGHKGLNGGTNPEHYILRLDSDAAEVDDFRAPFNDTPHTSTYFNVKSDALVNGVNKEYIAMLFASVDGISKVGSFAGSNSELTITTGFTPRFLIVKAASTTGQWNTLDTVRGWGAGNDPYLKLNSTAAQISGYNIGAPTATGFTLTGNMGGTNVSGVSYIYYAHA